MRKRLIAALPLALCLGSGMDLRAQSDAAHAQAQAQKDATSKPARVGEARTRPAPRIPPVLEWPKNRSLVVATLDGKEIRLAELATHLAAHYDPNVEERWTNKRDLNSPNLPMLLYQFVDVLALRAECRTRKLGIARLMERVDQYLDRDFETRYKPAYEEANKRKMSEVTEKNLRSRHRRENGLKMEVEALLDRIVPGQYKYAELKQYNIQNGNFWGGKVKLAQIFFSTRDPATGRLYPEGKQIEIRSRVREVMRLLEKDPSQFGEIAKRFSEDRTTAPQGGLVGYVKRLDDRLPSAIVTEVWSLPNGGISQPVPTFFGIHIVQRLGFNRTHFILFNGKTIKRIANDKKKIEAEAFLFSTRKTHPRHLYL